MGTLWEKDSSIKKNAGEALIECDNCPCVTCGGCSTENVPAQLSVTFTGWTNNACGDCLWVNDTFVVDWVSDEGGVCLWEYVNGDHCSCNDWTLQVRVIVVDELLGIYKMTVQWNCDTAVSFEMPCYDTGNLMSKLDCENFSDYDVPEAALCSAKTDCAGTTTCAVTAV